ncbi:MAG: BrnA antitoxin family protein [Methanophagales archaeon]|nr:BrnA antitoxin family protein [Methanophagales archaeon]
MESVMISARIGSDLVEEIKKLASKKGVDKDSVIRELLSMAIRDAKLKEALELVRQNSISEYFLGMITKEHISNVSGKYNRAFFSINTSQMVYSANFATEKNKNSKNPH